jgi:hypothetical protein
MTNPDELGYNGWANYETWNVALWLDSDEGLYSFAREYTSWKKLREALVEADCHYTGDGVAWMDSAIDEEEMDKFLEENRS